MKNSDYAIYSLRFAVPDDPALDSEVAQVIERLHG